MLLVTSSRACLLECTAEIAQRTQAPALACPLLARTVGYVVWVRAVGFRAGWGQDRFGWKR